MHSIEAEDRSDAPVLLKEGSITQSEVQLIEEISSTEVPEELSTPAYKMTTVRDANNKPVRIELKVELPKVSSVSECDLRISKVRPCFFCLYHILRNTSFNLLLSSIARLDG